MKSESFGEPPIVPVFGVAATARCAVRRRVQRRNEAPEPFAASRSFRPLGAGLRRGKARCPLPCRNGNTQKHGKTRKNTVKKHRGEAK
jgi:hypothetical protein